MFYIPHGSSRTVDQTLQQFDARTYQWKVVPKDPYLLSQFQIQEKELSLEWLSNNCHPEGVFKCPRCYRHHFVPDNFDILCDGCVEILQDYHSQGFSFEFTESFQAWCSNPSRDVIYERIKLRERLDEAYKSDNLILNGKQVVIVRDPFKNNGLLEFSHLGEETEKSKRFITSVFDLDIE